jgi:DNA (cytosine-5)-methyltransferase 1
MKSLTFGSLFAGIGGMDLGLERAGMKCVWQVEIDPYARKVLEKHWPVVRRWDDVRTFPPEGGWGCDLVAGGFPCQPVARGGRKLRHADGRWLWPEMARVVRVLGPSFVIIENVIGLRDGGMGTVLADLAVMGFDAEWQMLSSCAFGASHTRERLFIVAYSNGVNGQKRIRVFPDRESEGQRRNASQGPRRRLESHTGVSRGAGRIPCRVDRIRCVGNAVDPYVAEWIGLRIMEAVE